MRILPLMMAAIACGSSAAAFAATPIVNGTAHFRPVYRLTDIGRPGTPTLTKTQKSWAAEVLANPYWKARERNLWFAPEPSQKRPLIIFYAETWTLRQGSDHAGGRPNGDSTYYVVGEGCGLRFTRYEAIDALVVPPPNDNPSWPAGCYYDPFVSQRDANLTPPVPPTAPPDRPCSRRHW
jgi:hypothetical protein